MCSLSLVVLVQRVAVSVVQCDAAFIRVYVNSSTYSAVILFNRADAAQYNVFRKSGDVRSVVRAEGEGWRMIRMTKQRTCAFWLPHFLTATDCLSHCTPKRNSASDLLQILVVETEALRARYFGPRHLPKWPNNATGCRLRPCFFEMEIWQPAVVEQQDTKQSLCC